MRLKPILAAVALLVLCFLLASVPIQVRPLGPQVARVSRLASVALPARPFAAARAQAPAPSPSPAGLPRVVKRLGLRNLVGMGRNPNAAAFVGGKLYTLNAQTSNIAVIQESAVTRFIPVGGRASALVADPVRNRLYAASNEDRAIRIIANNLVSRTQVIGDEIRSLLFFEDRLLVGLEGSASILILDPDLLTLITRVDLDGFSIISLAGDPVHHRLYANLYERTAVIDSIHWRLVSTLAVKGSYSTLVANPADGTVLLSVYDSNSQSQSLVAFDPISGAERRRARVGGDPNASILNSSGDRVFIANAFTNDVSVIDLRDMSPVATIRVGMSPRALALDENAGHLYVANYDSDNVHLIDTISNTVQATIPLAMLPTAILADENTARVYVANASTDSVFVLEEERLTKEIPVGRHPADLAWDEQSHRLLVANAAEGTLSIVDEAEWNVRTTGFITRQLTTVAVDPLHSRLFAGGNVFDLYTLKPLGRLVLHGNTVSSESQPEFVRVNPALDRIYAIGWNGIPGSNSRSIVYSVDGATLEQRTMLASSSNITAIAIDPATNRLYAAGTHPLAYSNDLSVYDLADTRVYSLTLPARTRAMALNPQTHHLFMGHETSYARVYGPTPEPTDQVVRVLDSTSFGEVVRLKVDSPRLMARIGNTIYVVSSKDGWVSLIQDLATPVPPSPTPTFTPTPWPSWTPTYTVAVPTRSLSHPSPMAPAQPAAPLNCAFTISPLVSQRWGIGLGAQLGCPMGDPRSARFAMQTFEHGLMFYRADDKYILVLAADKGWIGRFDTWQAPQPDDSCPSINPPQGLKPLHGFGKLWCSDPNIREKIGAGTSVEIGLYPAPTQSFERGIVFAGPQPGQVYILYNDGKWE